MNVRAKGKDKPKRLSKPGPGRLKLPTIIHFDEPAVAGSLRTPKLYGLKNLLKPITVRGAGKTGAKRTFVVKTGKGAVTVASVRARGTGGRKSRNVVDQLIDASKPVVERLDLLNAKPGTRLDDRSVTLVLRSFRDGAEQITGSGATADTLLANTNFDGTGMTAEQLVREGRSARVLARLDDLRYGARG